VRALRRHETVALGEVAASRERRSRYGATKDALTALREASDWVCGKRLKVIIPTLLPALEQHGQLKPDKVDRGRVLAISAATIDRLLGDVKVAASGGKRRRAGFYSAIRLARFRSAHSTIGKPAAGLGGTSVAGSFIQTLTMVDVATGWTECLPLVTRDGSLVVEAMKRVQSLFPWLLRGSTGRAGADGPRWQRYPAASRSGRVTRSSSSVTPTVGGSYASMRLRRPPRLKAVPVTSSGPLAMYPPRRSSNVTATTRRAETLMGVG